VFLGLASINADMQIRSILRESEDLRTSKLQETADLIPIYVVVLVIELRQASCAFTFARASVIE
jgi:hypothetical protein